MAGKRGASTQVSRRIKPIERFSIRVYPAKRDDEAKWAQDIKEWEAVEVLRDERKEVLAQNGNAWAQIWKAVECY